MALNAYVFENNIARADFPAGTPKEKVLKLLAPFGKVVWWNGHSFECTQVLNASSTMHQGRDYWDLYITWPYEISKILHWPIDPRTNEKDWLHAVKAEPNAAGDAWIPKHAEQGTHHDLSLSFEDAVYTVFNPETAPLNAEIMSLDPRDNPYERAVAAYQALIGVQTRVIEKVIATDSTRYLGYYEQHPHPLAGHVITAVKDALAAVKTERSALWRRATAALGRIEKAVEKRAARVIETRWDMEARIAREEAAKKAAGAQDEG